VYRPLALSVIPVSERFAEATAVSVQSFQGPAPHAIALLLCLAGGLPGMAAGEPKAVTPMCAFLNPERAPRGDLLEAKLLAEPGAAWVERAGIEKVLKEQAIQAAFGPQGGADRAQLGKLLKADLLVLVRSVKKTEAAALDVVVCDTAHGLRLTVRAVPVTKDVDADVAALREVVRAGLKKFQEAIREVVAVPPLASTNLSYEHEYLKGAYAKLMEQAALANPGVVVVELAEAEAIASEIKLAGPDATVQRAPALYLLGEFRHQGRDRNLLVALKLWTTRGGKAVGEPAMRTVAPNDAPATLHNWVAERLAAPKAGPAAALDLKAEAKQLAELSRSRQRVADWDDAYALLEASLLLDANQPELNADAMAVIKARMMQMLGSGKRDRDIDLLRQVAQLHRRGFEHMEALITSRAKLARWVDSTDYERGGRLFYSPYPFPARPSRDFPKAPSPPPEVLELAKELQQERRAILLRLFPLVAKDGSEIEVVMCMNMAARELTLPERIEEFGRLVLQHQDCPTVVAASGRLKHLSASVHTSEELPIYRKALERLKKEGNAAVQAEAELSLKHLAQIEKELARSAEAATERKRLAELAKKQPPPVVQRPLTPEEKAAQLNKLLAPGPLRALRFKAERPEDEELPARLEGVIAAGPGVDVFWASYFRSRKTADAPAGMRPALFIMKEKGKLRRVWEKAGAPDRFSAVCFDGRYVWAATEGTRKAPALFILDPASEKVFEVTEADGLPEPPEEYVKRHQIAAPLALKLTVLDQGRACVAGGFGRAWIGVASFDPAKGKAALKVIHEAREVSNQADQEAWSNTRLAFTPLYMHALRGQGETDAKPGFRVLLGRSTPFGAGTGGNNINELGAHPLLIDPDAPAVTVLKDAHFIRNLATAADGSARVVEWSPRNYNLSLLRLDYPGKVRELGVLAIPTAQVQVVAEIVGTRLHIAAKRGGVVNQEGTAWWTADLDGANLHKEASGLPDVRFMARSSHYGLIAVLDLSPGNAYCEVQVKGAAEK
jgi:hypothetical protein